MKSILIFLAIIVSSSLDAQEIDTRLLENHGDSIYHIYNQKYNYYQYLKYEIDFAYSLKSTDELSHRQKKNAVNAKFFVNADGKRIEKADVIQGVFNFKTFGMKLLAEEELVVKLDKKTYLIFVSRSVLGEQFQRSQYYKK